ncbi:tRNA preQ1(34) S-adenosylmethionine ribosyltransferase-isomerase QueA [Penaeicola halotolerans]|uniref:tRNA preQ1(34) S-adenosylmethionine ribosyltransferase-isomerase QueA n=1 Tax=Penaeicola halotolerans TaxID=2793196 RepID=UPI001CF89462|nr:tRNA preQ1(34) S-adenosylmethionine ribosyltransferase-isomerase QueA [Penaeicola halotolerans]
MKLSDFKFDLPQKLIAKDPLPSRDDARLMVLHRATGEIEHRQFKDLPDIFTDMDTLVLNNTKVRPARLIARKTGDSQDVEVLLVRELRAEDKIWEIVTAQARKIRVSNKLYFGNGELVAEVQDNTTTRGRTIKFIHDGTLEELYNTLEHLGHAPIPEYLDRASTETDRERYQTVYSKHVGAVAAPSAGLHFTKILLKRLELVGVQIGEVTCHTGLATFKDIEVEDLSKHKMESEAYIIEQKVVDQVNASKLEKKKVCAVGLSTLKTLETSITANNMLKAGEGWTDKFFIPPHQFKISNSLITNFHLPNSTPLVMAAAFAGHDLLMKAYKEAIKEKYRFYCYGDAMLIL